MNLGERKSVEVVNSRKIGLKLSKSNKSVEIEEIIDLKEFDLYHDGIEMHCQTVAGTYHVWCIDNNVDYVSEVFNEYNRNFEEIIEKAMQCISEYINKISRSFRGMEQMSGELAKSFLEGRIALTADEKKKMEQEKKMDGSMEVLESIWNVEE